MNPHEEQFARNFIVADKRQRYLLLLESESGRKKLLALTPIDFSSVEETWTPLSVRSAASASAKSASTCE